MKPEESSSDGVYVRFWLAEGAGEADAAGYDYYSEGPCGETTGARLTVMPPRDHAVLEGEIAVEYDDDGGVSKEWYIPLDVRPLAVDGTGLIMALWDLEEGSALRVDLSGELALVQTPREEAEVVECPSKAGFVGSDYQGCVAAIDLTTGRERIIGFQWPCT